MCGPLDAVATATWVRSWDTEKDLDRLFVKSNNLAKLACVTDDDPSINIPMSALAEQTVTQEYIINIMIYHDLHRFS